MSIGEAPRAWVCKSSTVWLWPVAERLLVFPNHTACSLPSRRLTTESLPPGCAAAVAAKCSSLSALIALVSSIA